MSDSAYMGRVVLVALLFVAGCGSQCSSGDEASRDGAVDTGAACRGDWCEGVFDGSGSLTCPELDIAWTTELANIPMLDLSCAADSECVLVDTSVDCKPVNGIEVSIGTCSTAIASAAANVELWNAGVTALASELCDSSPPACNSTSLCPAGLTAMCVGGTCRALGQ